MKANVTQPGDHSRDLEIIEAIVASLTVTRLGAADLAALRRAARAARARTADPALEAVLGVLDDLLDPRAVH